MIGGMVVLALLAGALTLAGLLATVLWLFVKRPGDGPDFDERQTHEPYCG